MNPNISVSPVGCHTTSQPVPYPVPVFSHIWLTVVVFQLAVVSAETSDPELSALAVDVLSGLAVCQLSPACLLPALAGIQQVLLQYWLDPTLLAYSVLGTDNHGNLGGGGRGGVESTCCIRFLPNTAEPHVIITTEFEQP